MNRKVGQLIRRFNHGIYVNNAVDLSSTKVFGFDYDYTLAEYQPATTKFIYDCALQYLVEKYGYPKKLRELPYNPDFIIRGLFYDPKRAVMMKLDSYSVIDANAVFIGLERVSDRELSNLYSTRRMGVHRLDKNFRGSGKHGFYQVLDDFSIPEAYLLQTVVQYFNDEELRFDPLLMYRTIRSAIGDVHISQALYRNVTSNKEEHLGPAESMRSVVSYLSDKDLFIISNSPFWFINMGMSHVVGPDWRDAFEVIICEAGKPDFFLEQNRPFLEMKESAASTPQKQRYEKRANWTSVDKLEKGKIYYEGCLAEFGRLTPWDQKSVLYFGDQINADLAEPSLRFGWRTAAVIPELQEEIDIYGSEKFRGKVSELAKIEAQYDHLAGLNQANSQELNQLLEKRIAIKRSLKADFKSPFGSTFRTDLTKTHYARQLERYAELYTSSVRNFDGLNLNRKFFPPRTTLVYDAHVDSK